MYAPDLLHETSKKNTGITCFQDSWTFNPRSTAHSEYAVEKLFALHEWL